MIDDRSNDPVFNKFGYPPVLAGDIRLRDVFRPIAHERKDLMDYNLK